MTCSRGTQVSSSQACLPVVLQAASDSARRAAELAVKRLELSAQDQAAGESRLREQVSSLSRELADLKSQLAALAQDKTSVEAAFAA